MSFYIAKSDIKDAIIHKMANLLAVHRRPFGVIEMSGVEGSIVCFNGCGETKLVIPKSHPELVSGSDNNRG